MLGAEALNDATASLLRVGCEPIPVIGRVIGDDERVDCTGVRATRADFHARRRLATHCNLVCGHELRRPRQARQRYRLEAGAPKVEAWLVVPINEALHEFRRAAHEMRSHSFASSLPSRGSASSAIMMILPVLSISTR